MVGFPGAYAQYGALVDQHGRRFAQPPMSMAEAAHGGHAHEH